MWWSWRSTAAARIPTPEIMEGRHKVAAWAALVLCLCQTCGAYNPGDFIPMSRRGQYHNVRTPTSEYLRPPMG